ncbi:MAG: hypothetical protein JW719_05620 [Pirellulales bacterium]|nr:hypothetical protein [Pirellulales bacterium]
MLSRFFHLVGVVVFLCGSCGSQLAMAQQTYDAPAPVVQLCNVPPKSSYAYHYAARFYSDGLLYLWDGTDVWRQTGVNVDGFASIGQVADVPDGSVNMADAGPINFTRDGLRIILGNGNGGKGPLQDPPEEFHVGRLFEMPIAGATVSDYFADVDYHYDLIPLPSQSTIPNADQKYLLDYGCDEYMTDPMSWVAVLDETTGTHRIVVNDIPGASAAITTDNKGNLYACAGWGSERGLIKRFDRATVDLAYQTSEPLAWSDGVALNPGNDDNQSGAGMFLDARGFLFAGGNEGVTVFRPDGTSGTFAMGAYSFVAYNPLLDQILVMTSGDPVFNVFDTEDFLPLIPGDANWDNLVDEDDAAILAEHWGERNAYWIEGDFSGDGAVNAADAAILAANWGQSLPTTGETAEVPEPGGITMLIVMGLAGLATGRVRWQRG